MLLPLPLRPRHVACTDPVAGSGKTLSYLLPAIVQIEALEFHTLCYGGLSGASGLMFGLD